MATITVYFKPLIIGGVETGFYHEFLVYTPDDSSTPQYARGGPSFQQGIGGGNGGPLPFGYILGRTGDYIPGVIDYPPSGTVYPSEVLMTKPQSEIAPIWAEIVSFISNLNNPNNYVVYDAVGPNSNSVVHAALQYAGVSLPSNDDALDGLYPAPGADIPLPPGGSSVLTSVFQEIYNLGAAEYQAIQIVGKELNNVEDAATGAYQSAVHGVIGAYAALTTDLEGDAAANGVTDVAGPGSTQTLSVAGGVSGLSGSTYMFNSSDELSLYNSVSTSGTEFSDLFAPSTGDLSSIKTQYTNGSWVLNIYTPTSYGSTISDFLPGDTIDLAGISAASATLGVSNVLTVLESNGSSLTLQLDPNQSFSGFKVDVGPDGNGGSDITLEQAPSYDSITYSYSGLPFVEGAILNDPPEFVFTPGSVDASFTFYDLPVNYTGQADLANNGGPPYEGSWSIQAYGMTLTSDNARATSNYIFEFQNGSITGWTFSAGIPEGVSVLSGNLYVSGGVITQTGEEDLAYWQVSNGVIGAEDGASLVAGSWVVTEVACFLPGTHILTDRGETLVEKLQAGDSIVTLSGCTRRLCWIGKGQALATRGQRNAATPIIVRKDALADNVPHRDLRVTKGHSLFLDGLLIPVEFLVNHRSILWDDRAQEVTVYHLELDTHDVLLANGAPAESYRDDGNRWLFQNANSGWDLPPRPPCAPVLTGGAVVDAVWRQLLDRACRGRALPLTGDPDLHLLIDGKRVDAFEWRQDVHVFRLQARPRTVRVRSRAAVPQELGLARDPRSLGVAVQRIVLAGARRKWTIDADAVALVDGYHAFEPDNGIRWTDGDAAVPAELFAAMNSPCMLMLHLGGTTQYLDEGRTVRAA
jgi:hypothetical protein